MVSRSVSIDTSVGRVDSVQKCPKVSKCVARCKAQAYEQELHRVRFSSRDDKTNTQRAHSANRRSWFDAIGQGLWRRRRKSCRQPCKPVAAGAAAAATVAGGVILSYLSYREAVAIGYADPPPRVWGSKIRRRICCATPSSWCWSPRRRRAGCPPRRWCPPARSAATRRRCSCSSQTPAAATAPPHTHSR